MVNKYSYEFKTFKSGSRKGETYCSISSEATGKILKNISSKEGLQKAHKSQGQQVRRHKKNVIWAGVKGETDQRHGSRKQFEAAHKKLHDKGVRGKRLIYEATQKSGFSTSLKLFIQYSCKKGISPYIIGESNAYESDKPTDKKDPNHIEYESHQVTVKGKQFSERWKAGKKEFNKRVKRILKSKCIIFYGGVEVMTYNNLTGTVFKKNSKYYEPLI